ncbi:MAG TPA: DUF6600 domain-containing protein, partial [Albitalea sp.]
ELEVLAIEDERISLQLHGGSVAARLRTEEAADEFELATAEGDFRANRPGRYRFDRRDGSSHVTVWRGEAVYEGPGSALTVEAGQRAEFWLEGDVAQYTITDPVRDGFASWNGERDRRDERSASSRYVSPEMTGAEDLDRYGRWQDVPEYGMAWVPTQVPSGWAPYRSGHWTWVSPWGWTWVDDMPWGFAPFHYGRWAFVNSTWCWVPGAYVHRPIYAPAIVGWVGGPHLSVAIGARTAPVVGWFPLAPREVYVPGYRASPNHVRTLNVAHATQRIVERAIVGNPQQAVTQFDYAHRRQHHAVTVVPQEVLAQRRPVAPAAGRLAPMVQRIVGQSPQQVMLAAPPVTPAAGGVGGRRFRGGPGPDPARAGVATAPVAAPSPVAVPSPPAATAGRWRQLPPRDPGAVGAASPRAPSPPAQPAAPIPRWVAPHVPAMQQRAAPPTPAPRVARPAPPAPAAQAAPTPQPAPQPAQPLPRWLPPKLVPPQAQQTPQAGEPRRGNPRHEGRERAQ